MRKTLFAVTAFMWAFTTLAFAQDYPSKPITLVIPFAAGGPTDVVARVIAEPMSKTLGQPILVQNTVGAGGTIGAMRMQTAAPDGYTIGIGHNGTHAASVALYPDLKYNPVTDFAHIGLVNTSAVYLVTKKDIPAKNLSEFVTWLKANEKTANQANAGVGSVSHLNGLLFNSIVGVKTQLVSYRGTGPAMNDLVGGHVDYLLDQIISVAPQVEAGTIKAFAVAQEKRPALLPNVPTSKEGGFPAFNVIVWNAMFAPKDTPPAITQKINAALIAALNDPATMKRLGELGAEIPSPALLTPAGAANFIKQEVDKWVPLIKAAEITAE